MPSAMDDRYLSEQLRCLEEFDDECFVNDQLVF